MKNNNQPPAFPECRKICTVINIIGIKECESMCPQRFAKINVNPSRSKMVFNRPRPLDMYKSLFGCMKCTGSQSMEISEFSRELVWKCNYCGAEEKTKIPKGEER